MALIEYHRTLLADKVRNDALAAALKKTVRHGDTVIDIGGGTGFLAMIARGCGAGHCIIIERDPDMARLCKELLVENNVKSCTVMEAESFDVRGLPKADVVVSETLGNFAYEENIIEILGDAQKLLKPNGKMLPQSLTQWICPVTSSRFSDELGTWKDVGFDLTFESAYTRTVNNIYVKDIAPDDLLQGDDAAKQWDTVDFRKAKNTSVRTGTCSWPVDGHGTVYGFAVWWDCLLAPGVHLSTSPHNPSTHWKQIYLPLHSPVTLGAGDTLEAGITSDSRLNVKINVMWEVAQIKNNGTKTVQKMDMREGY
ncbi:50S ribosomal protein L11 methyltransferase [Candidatus Peregrinibacteria bacterium]|nr:50S ribosomal protein L11 methyltransferase [Candidatus Peregrinibacteria bacterium]